MLEKQPLNAVNKYRIVLQRSRKNVGKSNKELPSLNNNKDSKGQKLKPIEYEPHYAEKYLFGTIPAFNDFKKFVNLLYQGLFYSVCSLRGPSQEYIRKKGVKLNERRGKQ